MLSLRRCLCSCTSDMCSSAHGLCNCKCQADDKTPVLLWQAFHFTCFAFYPARFCFVSSLKCCVVLGFVKYLAYGDSQPAAERNAEHQKHHLLYVCLVACSGGGCGSVCIYIAGAYGTLFANLFFHLQQLCARLPTPSFTNVH